MQFEVEGQTYGVSFQHVEGPPSSLAEQLVDEVLLALGDVNLSEPNEIDFDSADYAVQAVLDRLDRDILKTPTQKGLGRAARREFSHATKCTIWQGEQRFELVLAEGVAFCSVRDVFQRDIGRAIALLDAVTKSALPVDVGFGIIAGYYGEVYGEGEKADTKVLAAA